MQVLHESNHLNDTIKYIHSLHTSGDNKSVMLENMFYLKPSNYKLLRMMTKKDVINITIIYNPTSISVRKVKLICRYMEGDNERKKSTCTNMYKDLYGWENIFDEWKEVEYDDALKELNRFRKKNCINI